MTSPNSGRLVCPACRSVEQEVVETRDAPDSTRRRRRCQVCDYRWTTYEVVGETPEDREHTRSPTNPLGPPGGLTGADLCRRRLALGLTQPQCAALAGMSLATWVQMEHPWPSKRHIGVSRRYWVRANQALAKAEEDATRARAPG